MDKKIPIYFDTIILDSPVQEISLANSEEQGSRLKVAVFTKYKNRNGSYITDEYAETLIASATRGDTPVVGFFDPETQEWASHTGPVLANGYGYVESFLGWEPLKDTDDVVRDYAVFSVVLFTKYYEEAKKIVGQHQSMELDPATISGDWANFDGVDYFVYTKGDMLGLCVIGSHEPCFSVSSFFSKEDDAYKTQYEKFALMVSSLKENVERMKSNIQGGEQPMDEFENTEVVETENVAEPAAVEEPAAEVSTFEENSEVNNENEVVENAPAAVDDSINAEFATTEEAATETEDEPAEEEPTEFQLLQQQFTELQTSYNTLQESYNSLEAQHNELITSYEARIQEMTEQITELTTTVNNYNESVINEKKNSILNKYEKILDEAEFEQIKEQSNDFSCEELESKLAIAFANYKLANPEPKKVPLPEQPESQFALLMKKYRKN